MQPYIRSVTYFSALLSLTYMWQSFYMSQFHFPSVDKFGLLGNLSLYDIIPLSLAATMLFSPLLIGRLKSEIALSIMVLGVCVASVTPILCFIYIEIDARPVAEIVSISDIAPAISMSLFLSGVMLLVGVVCLSMLGRTRDLRGHS
jgi:hypothetical protein